ncbi:MAG TPA: hypothetical protein ENJ53_07005 [Phaeodactylibacter sp.]|nr:hypothetical protein [Phaeodactylibacter sp.]
MKQTKHFTHFNSQHPTHQAAVVLGSSVITMVLAKAATMSGIADFKEILPWIIATSFILFYVVFNTVFGLQTDDMNKYWVQSLISYAGLAIISGGLAYLFSSVSLNEAGTIKWIFYILTFAYLVFLSVVKFIKRIVTFAENETWDAPKKRNKKRR